LSVILFDGDVLCFDFVVYLFGGKYFVVDVKVLFMVFFDVVVCDGDECVDLLVRNLLFSFFFLFVFLMMFVMLMNDMVVGRMCVLLKILVSFVSCLLGSGTMLMLGLMVVNG